MNLLKHYSGAPVNLYVVGDRPYYIAFTKSVLAINKAMIDPNKYVRIKQSCRTHIHKELRNKLAIYGICEADMNKTIAACESFNA